MQADDQAYGRLFVDAMGLAKDNRSALGDTAIQDYFDTNHLQMNIKELSQSTIERYLTESMLLCKSALAS